MGDEIILRTQHPEIIFTVTSDGGLLLGRDKLCQLTDDHYFRISAIHDADWRAKQAMKGAN